MLLYNLLLCKCHLIFSQHNIRDTHFGRLQETCKCRWPRNFAEYLDHPPFFLLASTLLDQTPKKRPIFSKTFPDIRPDVHDAFLEHDDTLQRSYGELTLDNIFPRDRAQLRNNGT
jgi:hypothetical protein